MFIGIRRGFGQVLNLLLLVIASRLASDHWKREVDMAIGMDALLILDGAGGQELWMKVV